MDTAYPFGLREVVITPFTDPQTEALSAPIPLPAGRVLTFTEAEDFEDLRGNDKKITSRGKGPTTNWELEGGGINVDIWVALGGHTLTETGSTPSRVQRLRKLATDARPFFRAHGRAMSDSGGDVHVVLYRCRATGDLAAEFSDGNWFLTKCSGEAFPSLASGTIDALYDIVMNESVTAISNDEEQLLVVDASGGTYDATHAAATIADITNVLYNASIVALQAIMDAACSGGATITVGGVVGAYTLHYGGILAGTNVAQFVIDPGDLTGGSSTAACFTTHAGG